MSLPHGCFADLHNANVSQEGHNSTLRLHSIDALLNPCGSNPIFIDVEDEWHNPWGDRPSARWNAELVTTSQRAAH